jgi:hypothetical protein
VGLEVVYLALRAARRAGTVDKTIILSEQATGKAWIFAVARRIWGEVRHSKADASAVRTQRYVVDANAILLVLECAPIRIESHLPHVAVKPRIIIVIRHAVAFFAAGVNQIIVPANEQPLRVVNMLAVPCVPHAL